MKPSFSNTYKAVINLNVDPGEYMPATHLFKSGLDSLLTSDFHFSAVTPLLNSLLSNEGVETRQLIPPFSQSIITTAPFISLSKE